jgi:alkylhydroperoxidase/carboxymuconolactone decarboxylase family protein YurZ
MKQTDPVQLEKAQEVMSELKEIRGGALLPFHRKIANDPQLLQAFQSVFVACNRGDNVIPAKYRELMIMILGCAHGVETTIQVHGHKALQEGATVQEVGEALRIALMICGASAIIPAAELFEELSEER